jgi:hypothetical protein
MPCSAATVRSLCYIYVQYLQVRSSNGRTSTVQLVINFQPSRMYSKLYTSKSTPSACLLFSIPDPGSTSKNLSILTQIFVFLSSRKYDPGCSSRSRIPDPDPDFYSSWIPDPGVKKGTGSRIRIRNTGLAVIQLVMNPATFKVEVDDVSVLYSK